MESFAENNQAIAEVQAINELNNEIQNSDVQVIEELSEEALETLAAGSWIIGSDPHGGWYFIQQ
jgi:hypothetical protein